MEARVKSTWPFRTLQGLAGREFCKDEWRPIMPGFEGEAKRHPYLDVRETSVPTETDGEKDAAEAAALAEEKAAQAAKKAAEKAAKAKEEAAKKAARAATEAAKKAAKATGKNVSAETDNDPDKGGKK